MLSIRLFGNFEVERDGVPLPRTRTVKEIWLLALLVLHRQEVVERERLAGVLWPDSSQEQTLRNLRRSLTALRSSLGENAYRLHAPTPRTIAFNLDGAWCDLIEFDSVCIRPDPPSWQKAISLYRGPLLRDCPEEWATRERTRCEQQYLALLERLAAHLRESGDLAGALSVLRLATAADPLREAMQRALIQVLAESGDSTGAILAYRQFRLRLHDELQIEPEPETTALYHSLRQRTPTQSEPETPASKPSLPHPLSRLIGRQEEIGTVISHLRESRLVTLSGSGGVGKTRLALAAAHQVTTEFPQGIWFVELAPILDPALVEQAVAETLELKMVPARPLIQTITELLGTKRTLLILDNCEHLVDACATLTKVLSAACPNLHILVTSRQALGLRGEHNWRVPSLATSEECGRNAPPLSIEEALAYDAVRLFLDRALEASPHFLLTNQNAGTVAQICSRLDGIPLAIELAAARVRTLSVDDLRLRLDHRFHLLTGGDRAVLPRHQTLRALIDWSYDLLSEAEKTLLERLSLFVGGWTLAAAEAVCSDDLLAITDILDLLTSLVDKSLVTAMDHQGTMRFSMLETVRQYARDKFLESGEGTVARGRHGGYFLRLAEEASREMGGANAGVWLARLEADHDNLRAALDWWFDAPDSGDAAVRMAGALSAFWGIRGYVAEGRKYLNAALVHPGAQGSTQTRAHVLDEAAELARMACDYAMARTCLDQSLAIRRALGDKRAIAWSLHTLGFMAWHEGDYAAARTIYEEALALNREVGNPVVQAMGLSILGNVATNEGTYETACHLLDNSLALWRTVGHKIGIAFALAHRGWLLCLLGDYDDSWTCLTECLTICRELGDRRIPTTFALEYLGTLASKTGAPERAARLYGANEALRQVIGVPLPPSRRPVFDARVAAVRAILGEQAFNRAWSEGQALTGEQIMEYALEENAP